MYIYIYSISISPRISLPSAALFYHCSAYGANAREVCDVTCGPGPMQQTRLRRDSCASRRHQATPRQECSCVAPHSPPGGLQLRGNALSACTGVSSVG